MIGNAKEQNGLYYLPVVSSPSSLKLSTIFSSVSNSNVLLWYHRLGHPNFSYLKHLYPHLFINKDPSSFQCDHYTIAKQTHAFYPPHTYKLSTSFHLIHSDVWGPSRVLNLIGEQWFVTFIVLNLTGEQWFVTFIDDYTRECWVYLIEKNPK